MESVNCTVDSEITDIVDLLGESELRRVLRQCGICADKLSHYELFRAFCECETCLWGHRVQSRCAQILRCLLETELPVDRAHCDEIWQSTAEALLLGQPAHERLRQLTCTVTDAVEWGTNHVAVCDRTRLLAANPLLKLRADSWETWRTQISAQLERTVDPFDGILYCLPKCYLDHAPNPYAVTQVLKKSKRNAHDLSLLHAQLLRYLFAFCRERKVQLFLLLRCKERHFESLLTRLKRDVGLPTLACAVPMPPSEWMLDLTAENCEVTLALDGTRDYAREMLPQTLARLSREYPCGRITVIQ